jgi:D-3-phosphoglycerate dehydrogenase / 2-oxoglutarate reductase
MRIAIPDDYQDVVHRLKCYELLRGHDVSRWKEPARNLDELAERLKGAEAIVAIRERVAFARPLLERLAPELKLISLVGRFSKVIDFEACKALGIHVATGTSASPIAPAELTIALILAARRNVVTEANRMRAGQLPITMSHRLRGGTLGIYGLGTIGTLVAPIGPALGMRVLVWGRQGSLDAARKAGYDVARSRDELFAESDVLSLHLRLNAETKGIVSAADLARMKPTALLVNTARAELIQPGALVEALKRGRPGYAALDVFEEEPVSPDHPLLNMPNVLATPHAGWAEFDTFETYFGEAFENVVKFAKERRRP